MQSIIPQIEQHLDAPVKTRCVGKLTTCWWNVASKRRHGGVRFTLVLLRFNIYFTFVPWWWWGRFRMYGKLISQTFFFYTDVWYNPTIPPHPRVRNYILSQYLMEKFWYSTIFFLIYSSPDLKNVSCFRGGGGGCMYMINQKVFSLFWNKIKIKSIWLSKLALKKHYIKLLSQSQTDFVNSLNWLCEIRFVGASLKTEDLWITFLGPLLLLLMNFNPNMDGISTVQPVKFGNREIRSPTL